MASREEYLKNLPSNSHNAKGNVGTRKIQPVVQARVGKKSLGKKLAESIIEDNVTNVADYVWNDVLIPNIKNSLIDIVEGAIEMIFNGERRAPSSSNAYHVSSKPKTSYTSYYKSETTSSTRATNNGKYMVRDIIVNTKEDANEMKALANEARKSYLNTGNLKYSPSARQTYAEEVKSLNNKLKVALSNAPKERQAQLLANKIVDAKLADNPGMDDEHVKKVKGRALIMARARVGASKQRVDITDKEWEAIQAGAISENILSSIIDNSDLDSIKKRATPRGADTSLSSAKVALIKSMSSRYTIAEIAERAGVSTSTVSKYLNA